MNKISGFIVNKRYIVMAAVLLLTLVFAFVFPMVEINTDMTKYLPDDSQMKNGIELMTAEFPDSGLSQTIRVMFEGLDETQKTTLANELAQIEYVESVAYDPESEDYNKDGKTLYVLSTAYDYGSREEKAIEKTLDSDYSQYSMVYKNDDTASSDIPVPILITVAILLLVILFAMCESWVEPFLFLAVIGAAIIINLGTNIFMGSISDTTFSIAAILQLVLSMDYSIILMNRYRQESKLSDDPCKAMKTALVNAFSSIWGSALTTIVGLLALVFMSFKIGADLGIVLAKGVLISMICVLTLLPALILLFDKLIKKSEKPSLRIPMGGLASVCYKSRRVVSILFVALFIGAYFMQTATKTAYTLISDDPIKEYFTPTSTIVALYANSDETKAEKLTNELQKLDYVKSVTSYATTLGKRYKADELANAISEMNTGAGNGSSFNLDSTILPVVYYLKNGGETYPMTLNEFFGFISEISASDSFSKSELFSKYLDGDMAEELEKLSKYTDKAVLTMETNADGLSGYFGIDAAQIKQLLVYYYSKNGGTEIPGMTLSEFAGFLNGVAASDPSYSEMTDELGVLSTFTNKSVISREMTSGELAALFGMGPSSLEQLFMMSYGEKAASVKMNPLDFTDFMLTKVLTNPAVASGFDSSVAQNLGRLKALMEASLSDAVLTPEQLSSATGIDGKQVEALCLLYEAQYGDTSGWKLSPKTFLDFLTSDVLGDEKYSANFDSATVLQLNMLSQLTDAVTEDKKFTPSEMYSLLGMLSSAGEAFNENELELAYIYYSAQKHGDGETVMSVSELFEYLDGSLIDDQRFASFFDEQTREKLDEVKTELDEGRSQLVGENYSRIIIETTLSEEAGETSVFMEKLNSNAQKFDGGCYFIGSMAMTYELETGFGGEMLFITLLTAIAIFIVVALTFRSIAIPAILVLIVQCGVYITVSVIGLQGYSIYYLALLMVQCILMGATIDYGILFSNYYRENRITLGMDIPQALRASYNGSIHTITTSGLIMILITGIIGFFFDDPTISQICRTISIGALSVVLLILFVLPCLLSTLDRFVTPKKKSGN